MAIYVFTDTQMKALADAIRAKAGSTGDLTIEQMTAAVTGLSTGGGTASVWKECWLEKPKALPNTTFVNTGIAAAFEDELEVTCRSSIGLMSACFNAAGSSGTRMGINFLPNSNKAQAYWGSYANTSITIDRTELDVTNTMTIKQNKTGVIINGINAAGTTVTWTNEYTATGTAAPSEPYKLFTYARNESIHYGVFRKAIVRKDQNSVVYTIVPEVSNIFTARLKITRKVVDTGNETISYVDVPAGFICYVDTVGAT